MTVAQIIFVTDQAVCSLPEDSGICEAAFPRFYFNGNSGHCEHFIYGGCGGNGNNFRTLEDCEKKCTGT